MRKYLPLFILLFAAACMSIPDVEEKAEYKCGEQIIQTEVLGSDSMLVKINGINNLLIRTFSGSDRRYENNATQVVFVQKGEKTYLRIGKNDYPLCQKLNG